MTLGPQQTGKMGNRAKCTGMTYFGGNSCKARAENTDQNEEPSGKLGAGRGKRATEIICWNQENA